MRETVLVVDDDPDVLFITAQILESSGQYSVLPAGSGEQALAVADAFAGQIALLLTDIVMPGLSGPELATRLLEQRPATKVLYMSAFTLMSLQDQLISVEPGVPILPKPFTVDAVLGKLRDVMGPRPSMFARPPRSVEAARCAVP